MRLPGGHNMHKKKPPSPVLTAAEQRLLISKQQRGHIGDAWLVPQDVALLGRVAVDVTGHFGPRTNETHFTDQHIPELRQFIELRFAKPATDPRDTWIFLLRDRQAEFLGVEEIGRASCRERG